MNGSSYKEYSTEEVRALLFDIRNDRLNGTLDESLKRIAIQQKKAPPTAPMSKVRHKKKLLLNSDLPTSIGIAIALLGLVGLAIPIPSAYAVSEFVQQDASALEIVASFMIVCILLTTLFSPLIYLFAAAAYESVAAYESNSSKNSQFKEFISLTGRYTWIGMDGEKMKYRCRISLKGITITGIITAAFITFIVLYPSTEEFARAYPPVTVALAVMLFGTWISVTYTALYETSHREQL